jgi:hypothetical protein
MIYWVSQSITPSMRLYYEQFHTKESVFDKGARLYVTVPTGTRPSTPLQGRSWMSLCCSTFTGVSQGWQTSRRR